MADALCWVMEAYNYTKTKSLFIPLLQFGHNRAVASSLASWVLAQPLFSLLKLHVPIQMIIILFNRQT